MKIDIDIEKKIKIYFDQIKNINELVNLINAVNRKIYQDTKPLKIQNLTYYAFKNKKNYTSFLLPKKSGGNRTINIPIGGLKHIQSTLNIILQSVYKPQTPAHGFRRNRSVVTNAQMHIGKNYVYNIDLKDFFPSIHKARIEKRLQLPPFNLNGERSELATIISRLTTQKVVECKKSDTGEVVILSDNNFSSMELLQKIAKKSKIKLLDSYEVIRKYAVLPQGAPTSPVISNIICDRLDKRLMGLAKRFNVKYTRYADDITFSSMHNIYQKDSEFISEMHRIIKEQNFEINSKKTRLQKRGFRQEVTGIIVNDKTNVNRRYIKQLRAMLYSIEKFGLKKAQKNFEKHYKNDKGHVKKEVPNMLSVLSGKLDYLKMVKGFDDKTYKKLLKRFDLIINPNQQTSTQTNNNKKVLKGKSSKINNSERIHNPKELVRLLKSFTQNNNALKYTTHSWEEGNFQSYEDFMEQVKKEWKKIQNDLKKYSKHLQAKISRFLLNEKLGQKDEKGYDIAWGEYNVKIGWSSPEIKEWCVNNKSPFEYRLPEEKTFEVGKKTISTFNDAIEVFKNEIEIRTDNNRLEKLFRSIVAEQLKFDFKVKYKNLKGKDFYTDVQWLRSALKKIFEEIKKRTTHPNIIIYGVDKSDFLEILIIQLKSEPGKTSKELLKRKYEGTFGTIANELCSLCDWSVAANCVDGNYKINYLKSNDIEDIEPIDCQPKGFTHILRFYK